MQGIGLLPHHARDGAHAVGTHAPRASERRSPMSMLAQMVILVILVLVLATVLWRTTDPDPPRYRAKLTDAEHLRAAQRVPWVRSTIRELSRIVGLSHAPSFAVSNTCAYYDPVRHRISTSQALLARLSDAHLTLILAHEVSHATRRRQVICNNLGCARACDPCAEESTADRQAMHITGQTPMDWKHAMRAVLLAEPNLRPNAQLHQRAQALGVSLNVSITEPDQGLSP